MPAQSRIPSTRLHRQLLIEGWNQEALDRAVVGVAGDDDLLASLYVLSAAALGLNHLVVVAPDLDERFVSLARSVNPDLTLTHVRGFVTHPAVAALFDPCPVLVDLTRYGLANKLLLEKAYAENRTLVRAFTFEEGGSSGFAGFTYRKGREWDELRSTLSPRQFPWAPEEDPVLAVAASGIALEETKNVLMERSLSSSLVIYRRSTPKPPPASFHVGVAGAGALGNFVGLGLAASGFRNITFWDADEVAVTNLNRQVFFAEAVGRNKAETLARKLADAFDARAVGIPADFTEGTELSAMDAVMDCVDNFESRILISEKCRDQQKILISGGTGVETGQVMIYVPEPGNPTPSDLLGLPAIVSERRSRAVPRNAASCVRLPDPSVIMTNQVVGALMVDALRRLLSGDPPPNLFYNSRSETKIAS